MNLTTYPTPSTSEMVEHKKALKIKITMQSPKTPAQTREAQKREPRLLLLALVGLTLGVGTVAAWWGLTGASTDQRGQEVAPLDAQLMSERRASNPSPASATRDMADPPVASPIDEALSEGLSERESTPAETEPRESGPSQTASTPTPVPAIAAEEIAASAERGSTAPAETEPQQATHHPAHVPALRPPSKKLAAVAPPPSSDKPAATPPTSAHVARALFTSAIKGGQPADAEGPVIFSRGKSAKPLYFFTELRGLKGKTVTHRWEYQGQTMLTIPFTIGGNRWRVYSNKNLPTRMTGTWRVVVADSTGAVLGAREFTYQNR